MQLKKIKLNKAFLIDLKIDPIKFKNLLCNELEKRDVIILSEDWLEFTYTPGGPDSVLEADTEETKEAVFDAIYSVLSNLKQTPKKHP